MGLLGVHGVARSRARLSDFTFTFHFHALEKEMATHSSVLAWRIPGTGEPGGLPSMGSPSRTRLKRLSSSSNLHVGDVSTLAPQSLSSNALYFSILQLSTPMALCLLFLSTLQQLPLLSPFYIVHYLQPSNFLKENLHSSIQFIDITTVLCLYFSYST